MNIISKNFSYRATLFIFFVLFSMNNFATTYYVSNSGNDSNNGTSTATPWKTLAKINTTSFNPGDQILLKAGNLFIEALAITSSGTLGNSITISSYGGIEKPEIRGYGEIPGWNVSENWKLYSTGIYRRSYSQSFVRLWFNDKEQKESKTLSLDSEHTWKWDSNYLYIKSPKNPATHFKSIGYSALIYTPFTLNGISNIVIDGIKVTGGWNQSLSIKDCDHIEIKNCEIGYRSKGNLLFVSTTIAGDSTTNIQIHNNIFDTGDSIRYDYYRGFHTTGDAVGLYTGIVNSSVHDNVFINCSHTAVNIKNISKKFPCNDIEVYNNFVTAPLIDYSRGFGADLQINSYNVSFHHNTVVHTSIQNQFNGNGLKIHDNIIDGVTGTPFPEKPQKGYGIAIEAYETPAINMEIYNNTILNCADGGIRIYGADGDLYERSGNNIHDNNIFNNGSTFTSQITTYPSRAIYKNTYKNNHLFNLKSTNVLRYNLVYHTTSSFNNVSPQRGDVISGNDSELTYFVAGIGNVIVSLEDLRIEYNNSRNPKTIYLEKPIVALNGKRYSKSLILTPYTSIILVKDNSIKPVFLIEYKSICEGSSYNGWITTGKYDRTLKTKSGGDSIVTTYLTVNPKYTIKEDITIVVGQNYQGWTKSGQYIRNLNSVSGCDSTVTTNLKVALNATKQGETGYTQTIELKKGYNLISMHVSLQDPTVIKIVKPLIDSGSLLKIQDEAGNSLENWGNMGGWINNLGSIQNTEGYKVIVANDCALQITGIPVVLPLYIPLTSGWNIISFPQADQIDAMLVIQTLIDQGKLEKVQDEMGNSIENWGAYGGWKNDIGNFLPGKAYNVKMKGNSYLTYQSSYPKSSFISANIEKTEYFTPSFIGNGTDHLNINLVGLNESGLVVGDELAAFDGERCVGSLKINADHFLSGTASLISSCSTSDLYPDGFTEGNPIRILVWNKLSGEKSEVPIVMLQGNLVFAKNASALIRLKSLTTDFTPLVDEFTSKVFPNPSRGNFTIQFSQIPVQDSRIEVLDSSGRLICSRKIESDTEYFSLASPSAGLYLIKTICGSNQNVHKLVVN